MTLYRQQLQKKDALMVCLSEVLSLIMYFMPPLSSEMIISQFFGRIHECIQTNSKDS
jgi:hypothetical protein